MKIEHYPAIVLLGVVVLVGMCRAADPSVAASQGKPNIILILADDLGYGDLGCYGGPFATPRLDAMAKEGLRFTDFHSNGAVCSPTRAALLTGRYQQRCGVEGVLTAVRHREEGLASEETTFAEVLKSTGYVTALFGKWHLGYAPQFNPVRQGFDEFRGYVSGNVDYHSHVDQEGHPDWWVGEKAITESGYTTDLITRHAVRFIKANKTRPFCLYLAHEAVHYPYQTRTDAAQRQPGLKPADPHGIAADKQQAYAGMLAALDESVGCIMDVVKEQGLENNTLVFFTSDNGPASPGKAGRLSGRKGSLLEGGHRVPGIAWWPGRIVPAESAELCLTMDLLPTLAALSGTPLPPGVQLDGVDLSSVLLRGEPLASRFVFWRFQGMSAARSGPWKLFGKTGNPPRLVNLADDLGEKHDLAAQQPEKLKMLQAELTKWSKNVSRR